MTKCLYNGVELRKVPEVEGYQYVSVGTNIWNEIMAMYSETPHSFREDPGWVVVTGQKFYLVDEDGEIMYFHNLDLSESGDGYWEDYGLAGNQVYRPFWTNHDILTSDGTLYLAASDPVPVTTINPSALLQWFFVGDAIKRNR